MNARPITFLSDYGHDDEFAGVCRAVIARIAPGAEVTDLTHGIRPYAVAEGAAVLARALPFAAPGVHLAVVDPGVGAERRAVGVRTLDGNRVLVGPDNGLLAPALERLGGAVEAVELERSPFRLEPVSATFHGRDVFAPVAAHIAAGATLAEAGEAIDPATLAVLPATAPRVEDGRLVARVAYVDHFGNAALDAELEDLSGAGLEVGEGVRVAAGGGTREAAFARTFAEVGPGELLLYAGSSGSPTLAVNQGSAAEALGLGVGEEITLSRP